jgi:SagB-type dehydrogenase family enzyme
LNGYDREFLKANWNRLEGFSSDQNLGEAIPPMQKSLPDDAQPIPLGKINHNDFSVHSLDEMIAGRKSVRKFTESKLTLAELSWLLWATQGVRGMFRDDTISMRTVPSGGSRHPFETYLVVNRIEGLEKGLYRYLPIDHSLVLLPDCPDEDTVSEACLGQEFCGNSAVCFIWTAIPYRTEWRYGPVSSKIIALDAGHLCQNLYLAVGEIGAGTCAIGAYDQLKADQIVGVDGRDEFVVYIAPVGKVEG